MNRRFLGHLATAFLSISMLASVSLARAADEAPDVLIKRISAEVLDNIKADQAVKSGDLRKVIALVDSQIMPNVDFTRMTASAVGRAWRTASPEQQRRLQQEFKVLLVRTYAGALSQVNEQQVNVKPLRAAATDAEVVVRTEVLGRGDPIQLDYRMEKVASGWKIYDLNVLGVWLVETYRTQFSQEVNAKGLDGLIASLVQRNKSNAGEKKPA